MDTTVALWLIADCACVFGVAAIAAVYGGLSARARMAALIVACAAAAGAAVAAAAAHIWPSVVFGVIGVAAVLAAIFMRIRVD